MNTLIQSNLSGLHQKLNEMSDLVIKAIDKSVDALVDKDLEQAKQIKKDDIQINNLRWEIEEDCISLIATQQPVASDLRELIALLNIITELERIGDYAAGIAKITLMIGKENHVKPLIDIPRMRDLAIDMVEEAMKSYKKRDEKSARFIHARDDEIDNLYNQVYRELLTFMIENPSKITQCTHLLWVAHNTERMGDRVTNICERVIYLSSGEHAEDL